jgi:hypothetical protein
VRITIFCTRVKVSNVMTRAYFGVDILRDVGSDGSTNLVFPLYSVVGPYNTTAALTCCCDLCHVMVHTVRHVIGTKYPVMGARQ